ncbi:hypothetical protein H2203_005679 [Taxawa tesnikishii (nom. ined.)]|nr:hypothetical protein H2203_005679 [Dothideales sp. JES 119]
MAPQTINILLSSFPGLSLPSTLSIPLAADLPISSLTSILSDRLPEHALEHRLVLSTNSNKQINPASDAPLSSLLPSPDVDFLPLRLSARLCGGKGGFGSQLRAAGGRMSSRKNRRNEDTNGSNRNLDGRRLRTITEAKNLATYLAMKPEMDRKEKEERRKRWEAIVESAERKEEEIKRGKGNVRLNGEWVEAKEEAENKTRDAVVAALKAGLISNERELHGRTGSESSASAEEEDDESMDEAEGAGAASSEEEKVAKPPKDAQSRTFFGWDEDEDDMSEDEDEEDGDGVSAQPAEAACEGKGKGRAE